MEEQKKTLKEKFEEAKAKASEGIRNGFYAAKGFWAENKEFIGPAIPVIIGGIGFAAKAIVSGSKDKEERDRKELYVWDAKSGQWFRLRRKLRSSEQLELAHRKSNGENVEDILLSMRVL